jgi:hypothetical protein
MTTLREAAQQALEAWEHINKFGFVLADYEGPMEQAITALRAALAQPEQEPVAWLRRKELADLQTCNYLQLGADSPRIWAPCEADAPPPEQDLVPVYTHPPRRETAQPEQEPLKPNATTRLQDPGAYDRGVLAGLRQALAICSDREDFTADRLARDIQDTINNQMALEQPVQEPLFVVEGGKLRPLRPALLNDGDKLYTHPPRREWQGLSEEEIHAALPHEPGDLDFVCARAVEAALKEKNHE